VSCTGLLDDTAEEPEDYRPQFERLIGRGLAMVCANPDIVVERGERLVYCAGALARLYGELGGTAILAGKPHAPIYDAAKAHVAGLGGRRLLAVGDGLPTDIRGACANGVPALFVTGGIHAADFGPAAEPDGLRVGARLEAEGLAAIAYIPALAWNGAGRSA
jgi:ribonucleotide monophosphatase NagD (HAD superfamily)